ncbi:conserved hypothetical protein [Talaromyces stipitatus ATCC 10500]|uniref:Dynamin N-terminal domain-containing protein n=1 Tax=Talaromyces stipitatus (strain ATCC 10500 / CBS 375.48 / QM 6759 / NRRL 1006) TaxID=441959 RepID=B8MMD9_TALSN|nr:uncharacterized protein TSTA_099450 [Talaromyces stipitatus ATCC 10500]EED13693.1 conserved hypothetical protein [Talaromyces stipitatus ATCC 10500]
MVIKHISEPVSERGTPSPVSFNTTGVVSYPVSRSTNQYTPSTLRYRDPDYPLPSIERDPASTSAESYSNNSLATNIPSASSYAEALPEGSECGSLVQRFQNLKIPSGLQQAISSPQITASQRERSAASPSPSIHITPTASDTNSRHPTANAGVEGLADGISVAQMRHNHQRAQSAESNIYLSHDDSADGSQIIGRSTASPSRRRRSGSGIPQPTHKVEDEEPPQALFYETQFQEALTNAKNVTARLARVLSEVNSHHENDSSIQSLCQHATRLSTFEPPSRRIVGLVGDSGVGKSSLINSLLDKIEFARASNSGAACTCVVTEYHFHDKNDYSIGIEYFTVQELRTQFEQLLRVYREHKSMTVAEAGEDLRQETEAREDLRQKAELAKVTFQASFRRKLDDIPEVLSDLPYDQAVNTMMAWVPEVAPELGTRVGETREAFEDINECSNRLRILTSEMEEGGQACLWPFIRKLKVYMRAYILSRGLILVDLPGLRDLNYARKNITERYVRQCDQIFAVAKIGRATTDAGVQEVFELACRASLLNIGVVCTQTNEAKDDWPAERARISRMEEDITRRREELASLEEDISDFSQQHRLSTQDVQIFLEIQQERGRAVLKRHIMAVRNQKVCSDLRERYSADPNMPTFCVSNTMYSEQRDKPVQESLPFLNLSGILELRRYCIGIVAESHLQAATKYIKREIPALLGSIELWIKAGSANTNEEGKKKLTDVVSLVQNELDRLTSPVSRISDITDQIMSKFDDHLRHYMRVY